MNDSPGSRWLRYDSNDDETAATARHTPATQLIDLERRLREPAVRAARLDAPAATLASRGRPQRPAEPDHRSI